MDFLTDEEIYQAFSRYDLGTVKSKPEYIKGDVNLNYKIVTNKNMYLLKYIVDSSTISQFELLGSLHDYLRSKDVVVPKIYKTKNETYVENSFILFSFIDGTSKKDWTDLEIVSLVINFTKLLISLRNYPTPNLIQDKDDKYIKGGNIKYCYNFFKPQIYRLSTPDVIKNSIVEIIDLLNGIFSEFNTLPKQLIHGDLNEMNALFKDGKNVAIIDLALSYDPLVYDLGVFCYWYAFPWWTRQFNYARYKLIFNTFQENIPLSPIEMKLLPYMIVRRSMMDIMLTLQYYWSNSNKVNFPEERLIDQIERNNTILDLIRNPH